MRRLLSKWFAWASLGLVTSGLAGQILVVNQCPYSIYLKSVQDVESGLYVLSENGRFAQDYQFKTRIVDSVEVAVGVSVKIAKSPQLFPQTQFEYTYDPRLAPQFDLYYDISNVNDTIPWQFSDYGLCVLPSSCACTPIVCPPQNLTCSMAYNQPFDDWATHGCYSNINLTLNLCYSRAQ
ncbi:hypothetical protein NKR23_g9008 [Pleurostoma richardsiae]|uniref:Uncharacterized protein n=1 Tax=Pleurostoma richardsiae TaxID=41990 RepID=A0AA38RRN5_9PEZI|nr:hypothetical protein NKR23_g9008 [Pleurostoma richardsiae]